jgi:hypothetical protein
MHLIKYFLGSLVLLISHQSFAVCDVELEAYRTYQIVSNEAHEGKVTYMERMNFGNSRVELDKYIQEQLKKINSLERGITGLKSSEGLRVWGRKGVSDRLNEAYYEMCMANYAISSANKKFNDRGNTNTNQRNPSQQGNDITEEQRRATEALQAQQLKQRAQESTQQAQQNQQRADQERQGYRKTHDPDNEAHDCLMHAKESKQFGGFTNSCNYKVDFLYCNYKPKPGSGADIVDCQKGKMGSLTIGAKSQTDDHTNKNGETYWFACKSPARAVDGEFVEGKGISARCDSADGRANQTRVGSSIKKQQRNPQTISQGPVSVTLIPTNNTSSKCYDIAYENRSDKHVDIFLKFSLTNNKTGEKGTSVWLGDNTNFDGLFGSANTNRLNPKTSMETTKTVMYNQWLMAKNFIFNNQPSDLYGFNNTVENCDDITAEIPSGGLKWNENAYQRHFDACRSPIKRNRPVGC